MWPVEVEWKDVRRTDDLDLNLSHNQPMSSAMAYTHPIWMSLKSNA